MRHISRTSKVTTPINKIMFPQQGSEDDQFILSASKQSLRIWQWDPLPVHCSNNIAAHWNNPIGDMQQMKGYDDLICLELDKNKAVVWLTDLGQVFGENDADNITNQEIEVDVDDYYRPQTVE